MFSSTRSERSEQRRRMWSGRVLAKYWALQLPSTALATLILLAVDDSLGWPQWVAWTIVALWVLKDAILYPFLWRAYDPSDPAALPYPMEGAKGFAIERIDPRGVVRISGELWRAELSHGARRIERGETVHVDARQGLTLLVEPALQQE